MKKGKNNPMMMGAYWLVMAGALNLGLIGIGSVMGSNLDVIGMITGAIPIPMIGSIVNILIGVSAVWGLTMMDK